jgi:pyruvyl transferase EpsI
VKLYLVSLAKLLISFFSFRKPRGFQTDKPKAVILLVPIHGNLGDQALGLAGRRFVDDHFGDREVVEVTMPDLFREIFPLRRHLKKGDLVFVQGGGSMGTRYPIEELARWLIFSQLAHCTRILFPQSSSFDLKSGIGIQLTKVSQWLYRTYSKGLIICIRDRYSLAFMQKHFPGMDFHFFPDIVLYLDEFFSNRERKGVMYCLREDVESRFGPEERRKLMLALESRFEQPEAFATTIDNTSFSIEQGRKEVEKLVARLGAAELVITDRLHGVILSYISNTPVLAIPTVDHKLTEFFRWIEASGRSRLLNADPLDGLEEKLSSLDLSRDNVSFREEFMPLVELIRKTN